MGLTVRYENPGMVDFGVITIEDQAIPEASDLRYEEDGVTKYRHSERLFEISDKIIEELGCLLCSCDNQPYIHKFNISHHDVNEPDADNMAVFEKAKKIVTKALAG